MQNFDNIDVQPTCVHFSRTRGGVFLNTFDDYISDMTAVTVYTFKHFLRYSFLARATPYNSMTKR